MEKLMVYLDPYGKIMGIVRGHPPFKGKPETLWVSDEIKAKRAALAAGDKA